jgi:hypothetical protein
MFLPWVQDANYGFYLKSAFLAVVLLVAPLLLLYVAVRRRSWRWGLVLMAEVALTTIAGVAGWLPMSGGSFEDLFTALRVMSVLDWWLTPLSWVGVKLPFGWLRALVGLPLVVFGLTTTWWLVRRCWRRLALLAAGVLLLAAATGAWLLRSDNSAFDAAQYYNWSGWYEVLGQGMYLAGVLLLALGLLRTVWRARMMYRFAPAATAKR